MLTERTGALAFAVSECEQTSRMPVIVSPASIGRKGRKFRPWIQNKLLMGHLDSIHVSGVVLMGVGGRMKLNLGRKPSTTVMSCLVLRPEKHNSYSLPFMRAL